MSNKTIVKYKGYVQLKIKINDKVITVKDHNNGLPYLQKVFCNFLIGNLITIEDIPECLDVRRQENGSSPWVSYLLSKIHLTSKSWNIETEGGVDNYIATFTAVIPSTSLIQPISKSDTGNFRLYLQTGALSPTTGYNDLAYLDISAEELSKISPGTQAIIEWSMKLLLS